MKWKTEEEMQKELNERISSWKERLSKDGFIIRGEEDFVYKGVKYSIKVLRYYNHTNRFTTIRRNKISDCHCVVGYSKDMKELVDMIKEIDQYSEFLWHDTLHSWNDTQTVEEQIEECHKLAKKDIDNIPNLLKKMLEKVNEIEKHIDYLNKLQIN